MEFLLEVSVTVDDDEIAERGIKEKEREIRKAIEGLDPAIGVFTVENFQ